MIFLNAVPQKCFDIHEEMTLSAPSERELIRRRVKAARGVRRKRLLLNFGLAAIRRNWRWANRSTKSRLPPLFNRKNRAASLPSPKTMHLQN